MSQFCVINENTEDTIGATETLQNAIIVAREATRQGQIGDLITVLDSDGKAVRQFTLRAEGMVEEVPIARGVVGGPRLVSGNAAEGHRPRQDPRLPVTG